MLPLPYTLNRAYGLLSAFLDEEKAKLTPLPVTRTVRGRTEQYLVPPKPCSDGCQATIRLLLKMAIQAVEEARRTPFLRAAATDAAPTPPPVATNNEALARLRKVSSRAIRDHLSQAQQLGIIVLRNFRGTRANFELWISTKFLWNMDSQAPGGQPEPKTAVAPAPPAAAPQGTNLPHIKALLKQYKGKLLRAGVDKLVTEPGNVFFAGNTGPQQPADAPKNARKAPVAAKTTTKEIAAAGGAAAPGNVDNAVDAAQGLALTEAFWQVARRQLYPHKSFALTEETRIREAIWYGVYGGFSTRYSARQWEAYHADALERLELVRRYLLRHPDKRVPAPLAVFVAGTGYFDADNANGFAGTQAWLAQKKTSQLQWQVMRALARARKEMKQRRLNAAPARVMAMTPIQLYRYHENQLRQLGAPALREFHAQVAAPRQ